ncbi:MAG: DEAD/DEAH box helicase [Planctomycetes bacterium]|nr:DEAD/DEAH box helicase [Planctomycetota bacterium]
MLDTKAIFGPEGLLAQKFSAYEYRPEQVAMFEGICQAIDQNRHLVVEAGTGIGKTFAYLIPAIYQSLSTKKPVIVSTNTINLQEQIAYKDIPFLQTVLPDKFTVVLAKGRSNYICQRRLAKALDHQTELFELIAEKEELARIYGLVIKRNQSPPSGGATGCNSPHARRGRTASMWDGSLSSFDWVPSSGVWDKICAESDNCAGKKCGYYEVCFYQKARSQLWLANIVVVNHPLLVIDAVMRYENEVNLLPNYEMVVIDEAHRLESVAQKHLGMDVSNYQVSYLLSSLWNPKKQSGFLQFIPHRIAKTNECKELVEQAHEAALSFFDDVLYWHNHKAPENGRVKSKNFVANTLSPVLVKLHFSLKELKSVLSKKKPKAKEVDEIELDAFIKRTLIFAEAVENFIKQSGTGESVHPHTNGIGVGVYWVELAKQKRAQPRVTLQGAPLKVNTLIKEILLPETVKSAIFTSATLSTSKKDGLKYIKDTLGIENSADIILDSPFNYAKQVKVYITSGTPDPNKKDDFEPVASEKIMKYLQLSRGRAFVLFTSYDLMHRVHDRIYPLLMAQGIPLYMQGKDMPRHQMLEEFRANIGSVILGADSFWQGVDVPGEALENIIITKLPFPVPGEPLVEARMEEMERNGVDSFKNYFLPEAILKLRQGFGRLIRTKTDKGIIVILDNRIVTKNYGKLFLQALPKCPVMIES